MKICKVCGEEKPLDMFKKSKTKSGRGTECKKCDSARQREYRSKNLEARLEYSRNFYNKNKDEQKRKQKEYRLKNKKKKQEYRLRYRSIEENREKINSKQREYYYKNKEKAYEANLRRKARKNNVKTFFISKKDIRKIYMCPCFACGSKEKITMDHKIPISRGGSHGIGNLVSLCKSCNSSKGTRTLVEWKYSGLYPSSRS
jgi:5-methylcytosine-specific restriction endonuclease McrA